MTLEERFHSKVQRGDANACWPWTAGTTEYGYGELQRGRRGEGVILAHRLAFALANGIDYDALRYEQVVMHSCDNPPCCNPAHLALGTRPENNEDRDRKGRARVDSPKGERQGNALLTAPQVLAIREARARNVSLRDLAAAYGVAETTISMIARRKNWRHI